MKSVNERSKWYFTYCVWPKTQNFTSVKLKTVLVQACIVKYRVNCTQVDYKPKMLLSRAQCSILETCN